MPLPGATTFTTSEAQQQRDRGDDLEIAQRIQADAAHMPQVVHARNAQHHRAEDDGRDQHLDQLDEAIAQRLELHGQVRHEVADQHADHDRDQHLHVQDLQIAHRCVSRRSAPARCAAWRPRGSGLPRSRISLRSRRTRACAAGSGPAHPPCESAGPGTAGPGRAAHRPRSRHRR